jgi:hypothetical protein
VWDVSSLSAAAVEFCGDRFTLDPAQPFVVGREGALVIGDDNQYLHRLFLQLHAVDSLWWLSNIGATLAATVSDEHGVLQAYLAPGAALPLVVRRSVVWFTAGSTTYEFDVVLDDAPFTPVPSEAVTVGVATIGQDPLTPAQKRLVVALCESALRRGVRGTSAIPTSAAAAGRLGWTLKQFDRNLDKVCAKLSAGGVRGLHGGPGNLAVSRRNRLVEYALATRLVVPADLVLLERGPTPYERAEVGGSGDEQDLPDSANTSNHGTGIDAWPGSGSNRFGNRTGGNG